MNRRCRQPSPMRRLAQSERYWQEIMAFDQAEALLSEANREGARHDVSKGYRRRAPEVIEPPEPPMTSDLEAYLRHMQPILEAIYRGTPSKRKNIYLSDPVRSAVHHPAAEDSAQAFRARMEGRWDEPGERISQMRGRVEPWE